ncbi:MAG: hypothetical protein IT168_25015 [Bryobacterales bacterium]|nr:hypothetical protein [Bryobacterales bacterium]
MVLLSLAGGVSTHKPACLWAGRLAIVAAIALLFVSAGRAENARVWWSEDGRPFTVGAGGQLAPAQWQAPREAVRPPFRSWETYVWYGSWAALAYGDWRSTQGALSRGAYEMNPLLACEGPMAIWQLPGCKPGQINKPVFIASNLVVPLARLAYDAWGYKYANEKQRRWGRRLKWVPLMIKSAVVVSNTQQAR